MTTTDKPIAQRGIETNGINTIAESERKGRASSLFWPWFAANVSVLGISYGSFVLGFGISFWQATLVSIIGIVVSFLLCGVIALAGKRGSAPTMVLSRATFGVRGNRVPAVLSWILTVGWETALTSLAVLATSTVFARLGWDGGVLTKVVALIIVAALAGGDLGQTARKFSGPYHRRPARGRNLCRRAGRVAQRSDRPPGAHCPER